MQGCFYGGCARTVCYHCVLRLVRRLDSSPERLHPARFESHKDPELLALASFHPWCQLMEHWELRRNKGQKEVRRAESEACPLGAFCSYLSLPASERPRGSTTCPHQAVGQEWLLGPCYPLVSCKPFLNWVIFPKEPQINKVGKELKPNWL